MFVALFVACVAVNHASASSGRAFAVRSDALPADVQLARDVVYSRPEPHRLFFHLLRPRTLPPGPLPVVVIVHGGAWKSGSPDALPPLAFALARRGFGVVAARFRLSGEAPFPAPLTDLRALLRFLKANARSFSLDSTRIGAYGASSGGQLAALLGFSGSSVRALVLESAPSDLATLNSGSRLDWNGPKSPLTAFLGGETSQKADLLRRASPLFFADEFAPPTLLLHGSDDDFIAPSQSEKLFRTLQKAGAEVQYLVFEGENHGLSGARSEADARIVEFLTRKLKARSKS